MAKLKPRELIQEEAFVVARKNSIQRFRHCGQGDFRLLQNL